MTYKNHDQVEFEGKSYECICADKKTAVFAPIQKKKDCLRVSYIGLQAFSNVPSTVLTKVKIKQWDGKSLKPFIPIKNAVKPSEKTANGTLTVFTKKGKLTFRRGQYIKQVNGEILKP